MLRSRIPEIVAQLNPEIAAELETAADIVVSKAKDRVPVDTGRLKRAIHAEYDVKKTSLKAYVVAGNNDAWYGHMVEHGTAHSPARPFLVPAEEESREEIKREVAGVLRRLAD